METLEKPETSLPVATTPDQLLAMAVDKDLDVEKLERLLSMKERWDAKQAEKAFQSALSLFQEECPELRKTKDVKFKTDGPVVYSYAPLSDIDRQIKSLLKKHGFTKRWKIFEVAGKTKVVCIISHQAGHKEETEMEGESDMSGQKSAMQGKGASITFMQRYTLIGALGLTTADSDIDARMNANLPELDTDKLHNQYMELYEKIVKLDEKFRTPGDPDNWDIERTAKVYVAAIGKARQMLATLTMKR